MKMVVLCADDKLAMFVGRLVGCEALVAKIKSNAVASLLAVRE